MQDVLAGKQISSAVSQALVVKEVLQYQIANFVSSNDGPIRSVSSI